MLDSITTLAIPLIVMLNACFVAVEFALVSIRWTRVEQLVEQNVYGAKAVQKAIENMNDSLACVQLGITLTSLGLGWVGEPAFERVLAPVFESVPGPWDKALSHGFAVGVAFLSITYLHIVLGELVPRAIALQHAERVALVFASPFVLFRDATRPIVAVMRGSANIVMRLMRVPAPPPGAQVHSAEEIDLLVEEAQETGMIPHEEATYVRNVFELSDKRVRDVMVPRDKVVTLSIAASEEEILQVCRETAHTRMPVWEGDLDHVVGIVNTKDLFHLFSLKGLVILMDAVYEPLLVEPDVPVSRLLRTLRREHRQMAIVHGGGKFLGIVTLEDILEEIVGEIEDEHDPGAAAAAPVAPPVRE